MSSAQITVQTAPRNPEELAKIGRFNLRRLAEDLGLFADEAAKGKFLSADNSGQAQVLSMQLQRWDADHQGGAPATSAAPAAEEAPKRTPSNGKSKAAAATTKAPTAAEGGQHTLKLLTDLIVAFKELKDEVAAMNANVSELSGAQSATNRMLITALGLNLVLAEEVLGAGRGDVIKTVVGDNEQLVELLKENGVLGDEPEEEEEEGN